MSPLRAMIARGLDVQVALSGSRIEIMPAKIIIIKQVLILILRMIASSYQIALVIFTASAVRYIYNPPVGVGITDIIRGVLLGVGVVVPLLFCSLLVIVVLFIRFKRDVYTAFRSATNEAEIRSVMDKVFEAIRPRRRR